MSADNVSICVSVQSLVAEQTNALQFMKNAEVDGRSLLCDTKVFR